MMGTSFPAVLERTRDGDPSAFAALWHEYQPSLLRYLRVTTRDAAEDVASETWAAVASSIARFDGDETAFRAWLFTVARRRAIDHFRRESRRPSVPIDPARLCSASIAAQGVDPGDTAVSRLDTEAALAAHRRTATRTARRGDAPCHRRSRRGARGRDHGQASGHGSGPGPSGPPGTGPSTRRGGAHRNALTAWCALFCDVPQPGPAPDTAARRTHRRAAPARRARSRTSRMPTARSRDCSPKPPAPRARASSRARRPPPPRSSPRTTSPTPRAVGDGRSRHRPSSP